MDAKKSLVARLRSNYVIDYISHLCYTRFVLAHEGRLRRRSTRRSEAWRPVASGCVSRRGRYGTQSVRSCDRAGGQVATWIRWTLPELKRGPAAGNRHGGAPRGVVPVATGWLRVANAASRLASVIEDPVWRLAALRRPPRSGTVQGKETIRAPNAARKREVMG